MKKTLFFCRLLTVASCMLCFSAFAYEGHTPLQAFIDREKSNHPFKEVSGLWTADNSFSMADAGKYVKQADFFRLDFGKLERLILEDNRCINLTVPQPGGGSYQIELAQYAPLASGFAVEACAGSKTTKVDYTPGLYYRGVVAGIPGSIAVFSFFKGELYGLFSVPGIGNYTIVPNTLVKDATNSNHYILYNDKDLLDEKKRGHGCATDQLPNYKKISAAANAKNVFNSCKEIKILSKIDYQTYYDYNGNMTALSNYITSVYNVISTLFRNEGIYLALNRLSVNTSFDVYQGVNLTSFDFLDEFGSQTQNNMQGADLALLFTTRYSWYPGEMGGVAWLGTLCTNYDPTWNVGPYSFLNIDLAAQNAFPMYSWNAGAAAHELGHNLGSPHTHSCGVWQNGDAIDACEPVENGPCNVSGQAIPTNGGTIMSYCHLQTVGINFALGFGTQPGNLIRNTVNTSGCPTIYAPNVPVATANLTTNANRECTDPNGITYYWDDGVNADTLLDKIVLKIKKGSNNIGNLDQTGFAVRTVTHAQYGGGQGTTFNLPTGSLAGNNRAMRRHWAVTPVAQPATAVDVYFPFTNTDISDVDGSVPGAPATIDNFIFYNIESNTVNPNPASGLTGSTTSNLKIYWKNNTASTTHWKSSPVGTTQWAQFQTTKLVGGTGFINWIHPLSISNTAAQNIAIYPNPFSDSWNIDVPAGMDMSLQVFTADGKQVQSQTLLAGSTNTVDSKSWAAGFYFYRITGAAETYTGSIMKEK
jgi:hypothetical protein